MRDVPAPKPAPQGAGDTGEGERAGERHADPSRRKDSAASGAGAGDPEQPWPPSFVPGGAAERTQGGQSLGMFQSHQSPPSQPRPGITTLLERKSGSRSHREAPALLNPPNDRSTLSG